MPLKRGFATMKDREHQRRIASSGGKKAHSQGRAHQWTSKEASLAGKKGDAALIKNRGQRGKNN